MPTRLYVGNLDPAQPPEKEDLERRFRKYGQLVDVWVSRQPAGFAFITYESFKDALKAVDELDGKTYQGRQMNIQLSMGKGGGRGPDGGGPASGNHGPSSGGGRRRSRSARRRSPSPRRSPSRRKRRSPSRKRRSRSRSPPRRSRSSPSYGRGAKDQGGR
mmetsp:Transcript_35369/g.77385  ORF Transcript_35369/g.77385 Transcript_35369/m.77385 type:complete len:160 (+) Transcript_35369:144-623(+)